MKAKKQKFMHGDLLGAMGFLSPNFFGILAFVVLPVLFSLAMAMTNWDLTAREPLSFVGLQNFQEVLWGAESRHFWKYFLNTLYFLMAMPVSIAGSLVLALLLNRPIGSAGSTRCKMLPALIGLVLGILGGWLLWSMGRRDAAFMLWLFTAIAGLGYYLGTVFFRTLFYLPQFTAGVALYILWRNLYNPEFGLINRVLRGVLDMLAYAASVIPSVIPRFLALGAMIGFAILVIRRWRTLARDVDFAGWREIICACGYTLFLAAIGAALGHVLWHFPALAGGHFEMPQWLASVANLWGLDPETNIPTSRFFGLGARDAIIFMSIWMAIGGGNMLLYLAGLSQIPVELYEVAAMDGAGRWATFWNVTWPGLAPTTFFIVIMTLIGGLQGGFEQARVMTTGGPAGTTTTLGYYIYIVGFEEFRLGLASAIAWIMFLMIFAITAIHWKWGNRGQDIADNP